MIHVHESEIENQGDLANARNDECKPVWCNGQVQNSEDERYCIQKYLSSTIHGSGDYDAVDRRLDVLGSSTEVENDRR